MIKIYGMSSCPDCTYVWEQVHVSDLKAFLKLRDHNSVFDGARARGAAGIPCFVLEDGRVTLSPEEAGLRSCPAEGQACSLDGSGC